LISQRLQSLYFRETRSGGSQRASSRDHHIKAAGGLGALASSVISSLVRSAERGLLDPARVEDFPLPEVQTAVIGAGKVTPSHVMVPRMHPSFSTSMDGATTIEVSCL
jgi:hypothetical protein